LCCDEKDFIAEHARENVIEYDTSGSEENPADAIKKDVGTDQKGLQTIVMNPNHDFKVGCKKCNQFTNNNIEGFVISKYHKCSNLNVPFQDSMDVIDSQ
jgi:UDP-2,3-diacylglucosamine pyrophosphatase LpxH